MDILTVQEILQSYELDHREVEILTALEDLHPNLSSITDKTTDDDLYEFLDCETNAPFLSDEGYAKALRGLQVVRETYSRSIRSIND